MHFPVKIAGPVVPFNSNPELGYVKVQQVVLQVKDGWSREKVLTAFVKADIATLEKYYNQEGTTLPGKIVVRESSVPFFEGHQPKINPKTGEQVLSGGSPVFRETFFTTNMAEHDSLLPTDRKETPVAIVEEQQAPQETEEVAF